MAMSSAGADREWLYLDAANSQKGPVPASLLTKLLEKGVGVSSSTLVWKAGMQEWKRMAEVEPFQDIVKFQTMMWHFVDSHGQQKGPVGSRMIMHKLHEGDIDGMTLVYSAEIGEWKRLSDIPVLKEAIMKMRLEEEAAEAAAKAAEEAQKNLEQSAQVYFVDDEIQPALPDFLRGQKVDEENSRNATSADGSKPRKMRKTFVADSGVKYYWDDAEDDWVECDDDDDDVSDEEEGDPEEASKHHGTASKKPTKADDKAAAATAKSASTSSVAVKRKSDKAAAASDDEGESSEDDDDDNDGANDGKSGEKKEGDNKPKRKRAKKRKKNKGPNNWIYITGLPKDITADELKAHFSKAGLIAISPLDQLPKIKIYREESGQCKGDAALCYLAEESVKMALEVFDGGYIRTAFQINVKKAEFTAPAGGGGGDDKASRPKLSHAQVKVAMAAMKQALAWNEDDDVGVSRAQALKIVVIEGMFTPADFAVESFSDELEKDVAGECGKCGDIEKITVFSTNPRGIVIVKFATSFAAQECIRLMDGRFFSGRKLRCYFWDGVTNYSITKVVGHHEEEEKVEKQRLDEFGDWLENEQEELPEEFRLKVEN